ncbi:MAG: ThuA domain-containing protein [Deinococcota bacterium]|nr:ThuA domain-containing protein [Deinococcota bacterium]
MTKPRVTIWNEYRHEKKNPAVADLYPEGIHGAIATFLKKEGLEVQTATLDESEHGLGEGVLENTDVLFWWGHIAHDELSDEVAERVQKRVLEGMGLVVLHSGHFSKPFKRLMGTSCDLSWREIGERERVWVVAPHHPIAAGLENSFVVPQAEMYGEPFDIPAPDELVFISWFQGGEVFRSGACFYRGQGKVFYFRPGHETFPVYYQKEVQRVLLNAAHWAAPTARPQTQFGQRPEPLEPVS